MLKLSTLWHGPAAKDRLRQGGGTERLAFWGSVELRGRATKASQGVASVALLAAAFGGLVSGALVSGALVSGALVSGALVFGALPVSKAWSQTLDPTQYRLNSDIEQPLPQVAEPIAGSASDVGAYLGVMLARDARDLRKASALLGPLVERNPERLDLVALLHDMLAAEGQYDQAAPLARRLLEQSDGEDEDARRTLYYVTLANGDYDQALEHAQAWQDRGLGSIMRPFALAWAQAGKGDLAAALEALVPVIEEDNTSDFGTSLSAVAMWIAGDRDAALDRYMTSITEANRSVSLRHAQLALLAYGEAATPEQQEALLAVLDDELREQRLIKRLIEQMTADEPLTFPITTPQQAAAEVLENVATSFSQDELGSELALSLAGAALYLNPDNADALLVRGEIYADRGLHRYAIEDYSKVSQTDANKAYTADYDRAQSLRDLGQIDEALALLEALAQRDPDRWVSLELMADFLRSEKRLEEAVAAYGRAVERIEAAGGPAPQHWRLYYAWGIAYDQMDLWPEAEARFLKSLELDPDQPNVLNYLAYSWVDRGFEDKFSDALIKLEKAVDARPNSGFIVDSLAWVLFKLNRFEEALGHMERAVELMPADPVLNDHLGDVYWKNNRKEEAVFQWKRALSFEPADKDRDRILKKLEIGLDRVEAAEARAAEQAADSANADSENNAVDEGANGGS